MLRIGIVGCGKIADGHLEQIRAVGRGEVVAVCDSEPLMAEQLGVRMGVPARYTDFEEMLARERLDVVHIATPPFSHVPLASAAMEAGCHVFVEKPFAPTASEARIILDRALATGRRTSVNYLYNFEPPALELEAMIERGELGDVVHLETAYGYNLGGDYGLALMTDPKHWVHRLPGKLFHNVLDHVLAKLVAYIDDAFDVQAASFRRRPDTGIASLDEMPDELRFLIRSGSVTASGIVSAHARPVAQTLKIYGTRDSVELDYGARTFVRAAQQTQPSALGRLFPSWVQGRRYRHNFWRNVSLFRRHQFHYFQCMRVLLGRFYDAIEFDKPDPIPHPQILRVCRLIDRIVEVTKDAR
jgi:predicted dehydrogenase